MTTSSKIYVGISTGFREVFRSDVEPTFGSHGDKYNQVMGSFKTIRGAKFCVHFGFLNPHAVSVNLCEKHGKNLADKLKILPKRANMSEILRRVSDPICDF